MSNQMASPPHDPGACALRLEALTKDFGGLRAVDRVDLEVAAGERRAIIGPNGAGKTTVFNLVSGELKATSGRVRLFGQDVTHMPPHKRVALRMGRTYQITNVFQGLTVEENVILAAQGLSGTKFKMFQGIPRSGWIRDKVGQSLEACGLGHKARHQVSSISYGEQRQLELAIALSTDPKVLLLDEPAAGLSAAERPTIAALIRKLPRTLTLVLIEHDMDLALGLVDQVTCLHFGRVIANGDPASIRKNQAVLDVYLGGSL
jgi:branched-chain amino acid transport system ATP-binding protein